MDRMHVKPAVIDEINVVHKFKPLACSIDARPHCANAGRIIEVIKREERHGATNVLTNTNCTPPVRSLEIRRTAVNAAPQLLRAEIPVLG